MSLKDENESFFFCCISQFFWIWMKIWFGVMKIWMKNLIIY